MRTCLFPRGQLARLGCLIVLGCGLAPGGASAQTSYTWGGAATGNWSTTTNWTPNGNPGAAGTTGNADVANFTNPSSAVAATYDSSASGYIGTLNMTNTSSTAATTLTLGQNLTINSALNMYNTLSTSSIEQINLGNFNLTIGSGATFTMGSTSVTPINSTSNTPITTTGTGALIVNGTMLLTSNNTAGYNALIAAPVMLNNGATLSIANSGTGTPTNRISFSGDFTSSGSTSFTSTGTSASLSSVFFDGVNTTIGSGTTFSGWSTSLGTFTFIDTGNGATYTQNISLGTLMAGMSLRNANTSGTDAAHQITLTKTLSSTATSGSINNAVNGFMIQNANTYVTMVVQMQSDLNLASGSSPFSFNFKSGTLGQQVNIDLDGFKYDMTQATSPGAFNPTGTTSGQSQVNLVNSGASSLSGGHGVFKAASFTLSNADVGIGSGVILQAATSGGVNDLGVKASGVTTISAGSTFAYTGSGSATLVSNRAIGGLQVQNGLLKINQAALTLGGGVGISLAGGLDLGGAGTISTLTLGAGQNFSLTTGTLLLDVGTAHDSILGNAGSGNGGSFSLSGLTLALDEGTGFSYGSTYQIFSDFSSGSVLSGITLTDQSGNAIAGFTGAIDASGALSFQAVPEPSVVGLALLGGAAVLLLPRLRRGKESPGIPFAG